MQTEQRSCFTRHIHAQRDVFHENVSYLRLTPQSGMQAQRSFRFTVHICVKRRALHKTFRAPLSVSHE